MSDFTEDLDDLETAEDFLRFFHVTYDQRVVNVNRLHILQRFHDYLSADSGMEGLDGEGMSTRYRIHLERAYLDFVTSSAIAEKTFKVHKEEARKMADRFVPLDSLLGSPVA
ncbi:nitrogenase-stabilizing/protective protein NifW [Azospirillum picis]|uniref:Nitrogenase-stabilizing/protective protein NifW n=1 Tax=Azospirillum picis TaxID=488438 RepID=A0ABU0MFB0_9PROT|nr:nitrogenase-stabilizing/protective protein NifW [Azospirillum picis]MBP2298282.1 nitrogenase-stabilizing/protective protein [Azospirillum picis]MDQ0532119.1 nitrogenase-stabilizing/protective protein [Azospirillum picis]